MIVEVISKTIQKWSMILSGQSKRSARRYPKIRFSLFSGKDTQGFREYFFFLKTLFFSELNPNI